MGILLPVKKILAVTGTRADYGIYRPVFQAIAQSKNLNLSLVVVGMHLRPEFGHTVDQIRADGFRIVAEIDTLTSEDTTRAMAEYVGRTTIECARVFTEQKPDVVFLLGDRGEQLAAAVAAIYLQIPIVHLHGGEQSGSVDDPVRHAITQLAALHFATAEENAEHIRRMRGGHARNIHNVGAPALDVIRTLDVIPKETLFREVGFDLTFPTLLFVQHPDTTDVLSAEQQLQPSLDAIASFDGNILILGANADAGGSCMNEILSAIAAKRQHCHFRITLSHRAFLSFAACADVLVGNSSSGIIEVASFHLPVVNIGDRQKGRLRSGNVIDVPYDAGAIEAAIKKAMSPEFRAYVQQCKNAYGDGHAAERIVEILTQSLL